MDICVIRPAVKGGVFRSTSRFAGRTKSSTGAELSGKLFCGDYAEQHAAGGRDSRRVFDLYLVDPLAGFRYAAAIKEKKPLEKYAQEAPAALDLVYKDDFQLLVTRCLTKAIDSRMMHGGEAKREEVVNQAMREGFILTAAFAEGLERYEKMPDSLKMYYPELIAGIDVKKEKKRTRGSAVCRIDDAEGGGSAGEDADRSGGSRFAKRRRFV